MVGFDVVRCFANDFKIAHDRILRLLVVQECRFVCIREVTIDAVNRFKNMLKVIRDA